MEIVKYARGEFCGLVEKDVDSPRIIVTGYYETVRHGTLEHFVVVLPKGAEWLRVERKYSEQIYVRKGSKAWVIELRYGDAEVPDRAELREIPVEEFEKVKKEQEFLAWLAHDP